METILDKINSGIDYGFSLMEDLCSLCLDKLSLFFKHAYAWCVVVGSILIILMGLLGSPIYVGDFY
jgi:hypothetical protein